MQEEAEYMQKHKPTVARVSQLSLAWRGIEFREVYAKVYDSCCAFRK